MAATIFAQVHGNNLEEAREYLKPLGYSDMQIKAIAAGCSFVDTALETGFGGGAIARRMITQGIGRQIGKEARNEIAKGLMGRMTEKFGKDRALAFFYNVGKHGLKGGLSEAGEEMAQLANGYIWRAAAGATQDAPTLHDYLQAGSRAFVVGAFQGGIEGATRSLPPGEQRVNAHENSEPTTGKV